MDFEVWLVGRYLVLRWIEVGNGGSSIVVGLVVWLARDGTDRRKSIDGFDFEQG